MQTAMMSAIMTAYSTAVGPSSFFRNASAERVSRDNMRSTLSPVVVRRSRGGRGGRDAEGEGGAGGPRGGTDRGVKRVRPWATAGRWASAGWGGWATGDWAISRRLGDVGDGAT